jgi:ADP-ribose pyrophosphatase
MAIPEAHPATCRLEASPTLTMPEIPRHARRVFQGILFDVYQWEQALFDGSSTTFEAVRRVPTVQILATTSEDRLILLREQQPFVGSFVAVPGGRVEQGKTPEEAVRQELLEELGMEPGELVLWQERRFSSSLQWVSYDYIARRCVQVHEPNQEPGERIEPFFVSFEEFLDRVEEPEFRNRDLTERLFRMRYAGGELDRLRNLLFG